MNDVVLKPCPLCGGDAKIRYDALSFGDHPMQADTSMALIECSKFGCIGQKGYRSTSVAIEAWNTRYQETISVSTSSAQDIVEDVWKLCEKFEDEAYEKIAAAACDHSRGFWTGQRLTAKNIRRSTSTHK